MAGQALLRLRENLFDSRAYAAAMGGRPGSRLRLAFWRGLFVAPGRTSDWRGFFGSVGAYCSALRAASDVGELRNDGTLAREAMMRTCLHEAMAKPSGPIAVVTGGFHTPALIGEQTEAVRPAEATA